MWLPIAIGVIVVVAVVVVLLVLYRARRRRRAARRVDPGDGQRTLKGAIIRWGRRCPPRTPDCAKSPTTSPGIARASAPKPRPGSKRRNGIWQRRTARKQATTRSNRLCQQGIDAGRSGTNAGKRRRASSAPHATRSRHRFYPMIGGSPVQDLRFRSTRLLELAGRLRRRHLPAAAGRWGRIVLGQRRIRGRRRDIGVDRIGNVGAPAH